MFEILDYMVYEERRHDMLRQAESSRFIRSFEIPGRRVRNDSGFGQWLHRYFENMAALGATLFRDAEPRGNPRGVR